MANWTMDLESTIFSIVKAKARSKLMGKYPNINFTSVEKNTKAAEFPYVYIHLLPMVEQGHDLEGSTINAVLATVQVDVKTNVSQSDAKNVVYEVLNVLKEMRFSIIAMPEFTKDGDIYKSVMRGRRMIGSGDTL